MTQVPVISIIDDDDSVRLSTGRLVRSLGLSTYTFASAKDFLDSPQLTGTSCLIVDVQMPAMTGIELQDLLRSQGRSVATIFISPSPTRASRRKRLKTVPFAF